MTRCTYLKKKKKNITRTLKINYGPVTILLLFKLFEWLISKQNFLKVYYSNFIVVLGQVMVPIIDF